MKVRSYRSLLSSLGWFFTNIFHFSFLPMQMWKLRNCRFFLFIEILVFFPCSFKLIPDKNMRIEIRLSSSKLQTNILIFRNKIVNKHRLNNINFLMHNLKLIVINFVSDYIILFFQIFTDNRNFFNSFLLIQIL
jgi:hypothetical protein